MSNKTFDPTKPVQTRDGRAARIVCTDYKAINGESLCVLITAENGRESFYSHFADGSFEKGSLSQHDLVNLPEKREVWVNVYPENSIINDAFHPTKELADAGQATCVSRIACIKLEYTVPTN